jgi:HIV Tat-specific factor 1
VTSIPFDATVDEIREIFSRCGVIAEEIDSGRSRIKMYTDSEGTFKGEALVVYFRPESVNLAVQMLDDSDFRLGVRGPCGPMRVQPADFSFKSQQEVPTKTSARDMKKILKKTQKLKRLSYSFYLPNGSCPVVLIRVVCSKLADWDDDEPVALANTSSRWEKVVVLKHMFTLKEIEVCTLFLHVGLNNWTHWIIGGSSRYPGY